MTLSASRLAVVFTLVASSAVPVAAAPAPARASVRTEALKTETLQFLRGELTAHLGAVGDLGSPPERVFGALTTGKFSWGTFMRSLAVYHEITRDDRLGDRDVAREIGRMGLIEARTGAVTFSQLYAALALRHYGRNLQENALWAALSESEREEWKSLLDVTRFYDPEKKSVGALAENYFGVAARIAAVGHDVGLQKDRAMLDDLLDLAAKPFTSGNLYADDRAPYRVFDRYSNEYARFLWVSAGLAGRRDLQEALRPTLKRQMELWWDIVSSDGYSTPWGRSIGLISYLDSLEIAAFLAEYPDFRPAPLPEIAAVFHRAWRWLRREYDDEAHLLNVFAFGRGNYYYITREREWQQTTGFFGKLGDACQGFFAGLEREGLLEFPDEPRLPDVARFEFFRQEGRMAGVWMVRQGLLRFAVPFTTGNMRPALDDYMPAPHGLAGFAAPVERQYPALVPFFELEDGTTIVATDGADAIEPAADGRSVKAVWRRFVKVGSKHGDPLIEPGFRSEVVFALDGDRLRRTETFVAERPVAVKRFWFALPTTAARAATAEGSGEGSWTFASPEGALEMGVDTPWAVDATLVATRDSAEGRGPRLPLPLHLQIASRETMMLAPTRPKSWSLWLRVRPASGGTVETAFNTGR